MRKIINSIAILCLILANYTSNSQCVAFAQNYASACGGSVSVNINSTVNTSALASAAGINSSSTYWRAVFYVTGGTSSGATNPVLGASGSQSFTGSGTFTTSGAKTCPVSIQSSNSYNGSWITRQSFSMNNPPSCVSAILNVDIFAPNTGLNFKINGLAQTTSTPATTYKCNGVDRITMDNLTFGSIVSYKIKVEKGIWSSNTFTPTSSQTSALFTATSIPVTDLTTLFNPYLNAYTGYLRVTLTADGQTVCGASVNKVQIFNISSSAANVNFNMNANNCSGLPNGNLRYTGPLPIPNASFTTSPCIPGWQGAFTAGYFGTNFVGTIGAITSHNMLLEEVNPNTGVSISTLFNITGTGQPPLSSNFNTMTTPSLFFYTNYAALSSNNRTFKFTLTVNTALCTDKDVSYFRISNGGSINKSGTVVNTYPNPANDIIKFEWNNESAIASTGLIQISDIYGVRYINQEIEEGLFLNTKDIDISTLREGNYIYTITTENFTTQGKFQKN